MPSDLLRPILRDQEAGTDACGGAHCRGGFP